MKSRAAVSLMLITCLLFAPAVTFGKKGEKNFRQGLKFEANQQWDRAVQEFVLAVASEPSNMEYQLHYRRALFHASQSCMQQGQSLANQHDYVGAYNSFRQAHAYDGVNQLAISEMQRMLRLQEESKSPFRSPGVAEPSPSFTPASYRFDRSPAELKGHSNQDGALPRPQQVRVISYNGDLETFITTLADQLSLNVVFDKQSFSQPRNLRINLRNVTTAKALDLIFLKEGLFFQKVDRRTILVADHARRPQYQQLVLRTFYLSNIEPQDAQRIVQSAIPPSVGRPQTIVVADKSTNSLTVRDTAENTRLIGELIKNVDKDRSEVVMDVQIYEVSATDLLHVGNQLGTESTLANLGGASNLSVIGGSRQVAQQLFPATTALGAAFVLPASTLSLLQKKNRTRVLASTQMHAFDGEKSEVHIGQRVPVQTAQVFTGTPAAPGSTAAPGVFSGTGFPVINYEPTGLTLEFTPQVYPNLDVQVKMSIKSNDVTGSTGLTPSFTERTLSGTARIQNNQTMMIASVSTDQQTQGRAGLPLVGLIPVLGRFFTAPNKDGKQTDIVVAVTPRVLRAPAITPRDEEARLSGTSQTPTTESMEAVVAEADREDQIAAQMDSSVQRPGEEPATYVPAPKSAIGDASALSFHASDRSSVQALPQIEAVAWQQPSPLNALIGYKMQRLDLANRVVPALGEQHADLKLVTDRDKLRTGEKTNAMLMLSKEDVVSLVAIKLKFDPGVVRVQGISAGGSYQQGAPQISQSEERSGELVLQISGLTTRGSGVLLKFTIEGTGKGETLIEIVRDAVHLITPESQKLIITRSGEARITVE